MATSSFYTINQFVADAFNKKHDLASDTFVVALTVASPSSLNTCAANLTEISYTNLSSRTLTVSSATQASGIFNWRLSTLTLTASGAVAGFRYATVENFTSASSPLCFYYDYGSVVTLANTETFAIPFASLTTGAFQVS